MNKEITSADKASAKVMPSTTEPKKTRKKGGILLFLPAFMNKIHIIRWLKKIHAWTGFWGALSFLLLGVSGFLLNHRSIMKIDTGGTKEVMNVLLSVDPNRITSVEKLGVWAQEEFGIKLKARAPRAKKSEPKKERQKTIFMDKEVEPVIVWVRRFSAANANLLVEYSPGSSTVKATKQAKNGWSLIKNLHKGSGLGVVWILFLDLMAGALIAMSLTGALLWSRLHGTRLLAISIVCGSLLLGLLTSVPVFL